MRGVTPLEFAEMCNRHRRYGWNPVPFETIPPFLERCCDLGLLSREVGEDGRRRYVPTRKLFLATGQDAG